MFPETFVTALIAGALVMTTVSLVALLVLLLRDYLNKRLW